MKGRFPALWGRLFIWEFIPSFQLFSMRFCERDGCKQLFMYECVEMQLTACCHLMSFNAGTDEDAILMLLTARSNGQRQQIKAAYKKAYGKVRWADDRRQWNRWTFQVTLTSVSRWHSIKTQRFLNKSSESASPTIPLFSLSEQITLYLSCCEYLLLINSTVLVRLWQSARNSFIPTEEWNLYV